MTREEAIKNIKEHCYFASLLPQAKEALDIAIKALQEPCEDMEREYEKAKALFSKVVKSEDCISRQAVDELSKELVHTTRDKADFLCNFWEGLRKLPSVNPKEPKTDVLDEIRAEIEQAYIDDGAMQEYTVDRCIDIIDKYRE